MEFILLSVVLRKYNTNGDSAREYLIRNEEKRRKWWKTKQKGDNTRIKENQTGDVYQVGKG